MSQMIIKSEIYSALKAYNIACTLSSKWIESTMSFNGLDQQTVRSLILKLKFYQSKIHLHNSIPIIEEEA